MAVLPGRDRPEKPSRDYMDYGSNALEIHPIHLACLTRIVGITLKIARRAIRFS
jgi:hypothetical protein